MNVILYSINFEPITVVTLPLWLLDRAEKQGIIKLKVTSNEDSPIITIYCKRLQWDDNTIKPILVTSDEVLALTLNPAWLPGQNSVVQNSQKLLRKLHNKVIQLMRKN